jgi:hypothetical protein
MVIQSSNPMNVTATSGRSAQQWLSWSAPVGTATQYVTGGILSGGRQTTITVLYWGMITPGTGPNNTSANGFDWANITDVIFNLGPTVTPGNVSLYVDHLYFNQSYQPATSGIDQDALNVYGQRMQFYDASMYYTDAGLKKFANARTTTLSPPAMRLDVLTSLGPEAESATVGFQPGLCFAAGNVNVSNYGYDLVKWRAVEVETHVRVGNDGGCTTKFGLTPASTTGVGVDMAMYDSRRFW